MNNKYEKRLQKLQSASVEELQKNMEKLFRENIELKTELEELKKVSDEMEKTLELSLRFTKSLSDVADNLHTQKLTKPSNYVISNNI